jgi:hypothetical protein
MSVTTCITNVAQEIENTRKLTKEEKEALKAMAEEIDTKVSELKKASSPQDTKRLLDEVKAMMAENAEKLSNFKISHLNEVVKTNTIKTRMDELRGKDGKFKSKDVERFLKNLIDGDGSIDSVQRSVQKKISDKLKNGLRDMGVEKIAQSGELDADIYRAMHAIERGQTPVYRNKQVEQVVQAIREANDFAHALTVNAGVKIGYKEGYLVKNNNYDKAKLNDNRVKVVDDFEARLDIDESFSKTKAELFKSNRDAYRAYLTEMVDEMAAPYDVDLTGNRVNKDYKDRLKSRKLMFKDGDGSFYMEKTYGHEGTLMQNLENTLQSTATFIGNAQVLGINPARSAARILEYAKNNLADPENSGKLQSEVTSAFINTVAPPHHPVDNVTKFVNTMRAMSAFTKLGSSAFTAGYDVISSSLQYSAKSGKPIIQSFVESIQTFSTTALKDLATDATVAKDIDRIFNLGLSIDPLMNMGMTSSNNRNFFGEKGNKFLSVFSRMTGTPLQTMYSKATNAILHATNFESMLKNPNEYQLQNIIKKYGFSDAEVKALNGIKRVEVDGIKIIDPADLMKLDMPLADAQNLMLKYSTYMDDMVNKATPTPTSRTRRQMWTGYDKDKSTRDLFRLIMQFKETAWKLANSNAEALGEIHTVGGKGRVAANSVELAVVGAITYLGIESAKAALFGRKNPIERLQEDQDYARITFDYLNRVAFAPVISDFIESSYSGKPGAAAEFFLGPNYAVAKDFGNIAKSAIEGDGEKFQENLGKFVKRNVLPSNWIPLKAAEGLLLQHDITTGRKFR